MNPQIKAEWVAALRSGKYKQGKGALRRENKFCCLGVLCDLAEKQGLIKWSFLGDAFEAVPIENSGLADGGLPPLPVERWAELDTVTARVHTAEYGRAKLYILNDSYELTFPQIADLIEAQL